MVGPKITQTREVGIIKDEMHPYTFFIETSLFENKMYYGCISSLIIPITLVCVIFGPIIPTSSIYLFVFYTCLYMYTELWHENAGHSYSSSQIKVCVA